MTAPCGANQTRRELLPGIKPYYDVLPALTDDDSDIETQHKKVTALASLHQLACHPSLIRVRDVALSEYTIDRPLDELETAQKKAQLLKEIRTHLKVRLLLLNGHRVS